VPRFEKSRGNVRTSCWNASGMHRGGAQLDEGGPVEMLPTCKDVPIGKRTCDSLRAQARVIAIKLQKEVNQKSVGGRQGTMGDPTRLVSLCCNLAQLNAVVHRAIDLGVPPVPPELVELAGLIEESLGPAMAFALLDLDEDPQISPERIARASANLARLLDVTQARDRIGAQS
jgi:hypothetical protein